MDILDLKHIVQATKNDYLRIQDWTMAGVLRDFEIILDRIEIQGNREMVARTLAELTLRIKSDI